MIYKWKNGSRISLAAQIAGERLDRLRMKHGGNLTPEDVVRDAKRESSPLHPAFEWDDDAAAHEYRLVQARSIMRALVVVIEQPDSEPVETRALVVVMESDSSRQVYTDVQVAMADPDMRQQVIRRALSEAESFKAKYQGYSELADIFEAIDAVAERLELATA